MKEFYPKNQQKKNHFQTGLLEYPQYTRPEVFEGVKVPEVLLSGNHKNIAKWRNEQSIQITREKRPDLLKNEVPSQKQMNGTAHEVNYCLRLSLATIEI